MRMSSKTLALVGGRYSETCGSWFRSHFEVDSRVEGLKLRDRVLRSW